MNKGNRGGMQSKPAWRRHARFWFGTGLTQFLSAELKDFPERRIAALRLFTVSLTIALVSQSLHVPPLGAVAVLICLSYDAYANAGQSLQFGLRQIGYMLITVMISVFTLIFCGDNIWLMLPVSFLVMAVGLFHARLIAWPTGIPLWFSMSVLYSPSTPDENIYSALWIIPIIGLLGHGVWTLVHLLIKPQDPFIQLQETLISQLAAVEFIFKKRLADSGIGGPCHRPEETKIGGAGGFGKITLLLSNAEFVHPRLRKQRRAYKALLLEIDGLRQLAAWLELSLSAEFRARRMSPEKIKVYMALRSACAALRLGVEKSYDFSELVNGLLTQEVLHEYSRETNPTVLTALWNALLRTSDLLRQIYHPEAITDEEPDRETASAAEEAASRMYAWLRYDFWEKNADSLQFGIKFSLGAIICMLIVQGLQWPEINTAIVTCLVAAQTSLGADYRLSLLRIAGAAAGGLCAYLYLVAFQSQLDTIAGFTLATAPVWALAAWISAGSERIAYLGRQLGFSFALFVLHDFNAVTDLYLPRDRVIGILLGLVVMGVLDYALWPRRSITLAAHHSAAALRALSRFSLRMQDASHLLSMLPLRLAAEKDLAAATLLISHAVLEPDARFKSRMHKRAALRAIVRDAGHVSALLQVRRRYRLLSGQRFSAFPQTLQLHSRAFDDALSDALEHAAEILQGQKQAALTNAADVHELLKQSYTDYHGIDNLPDDLAKEWELRFMLDRQIIAMLDSIQIKAQYFAAK